MPIPMPTVVAKGATALSLDKRYSTPEGRWASLQALRYAYANNQTGLDAATTANSLPTNEIDHLKTHWFDENNDHWMVLKPVIGSTGLFPGVYFEFEPKQSELNEGARILTAGLIQALECSLGLNGATDKPPLLKNTDGTVQTNDVGLELVDVDELTKTRRCLPIDVYWVCGKLDGFEVQVSWNEHQVTCFILTPQVAAPADVFQYISTGSELATLKTDMSHTRGMLVTTKLKGEASPTTIILAKAEGGVNDPPISSPTAGATGGIA